MRTHIINPTVTMVMNTIGGRQDKIARAIKSFIAQDYPFAKLLILNRHPEPLRVVNVPDTMKLRIEVVNQDDTFLRLLHQDIWNLKNIRTDCWTVFDDDDWIEPNHLTQLVKEWNKHIQRTDAPLQVCGLTHLAHYSGRTEVMKFRGWTVSLFETLTPAEVDWCFKLFPADELIGIDRWISWNSYFDKKEFEMVQSYHWDRTGADHISQHETNRGLTDKERFEVVLNYWRVKDIARKTKLNPVIL